MRPSAAPAGHRLGETQPRHARARVLAATNKDIHAAIQTGQFREDLYHRLSVLTVRVPALNERNGDKRWLVVDAAPGQVWTKARDFWLTQGFIVEMEDPSIGIMETDWAEKREAFRSGAR